MDSVLKQTKQLSSTRNIDISDEKNSVSSETGQSWAEIFYKEEIFINFYKFL